MARALCPGPFELTGAELRDPWLCCREQHIDVLRWRGATSTAIALHRVGLDDLASQLAAWVYQNDPTDVMSRLFGDMLELAGVRRTEIDQPVDLDVLIDKLFAVADELDGISA